MAPAFGRLRIEFQGGRVFRRWPTAWPLSLQIAAPPETKSVSPVIHRASSDARNDTGGAMSSGRPARPNGVAAIAPFSKSLPAIPAASTPSVITSPGLTAFTRILRAASSFARDFVIVSTAPFVEAYTDAAGGAKELTTELTLTTLPPSLGKYGRAALVVSNTPST